MNTIQNHLVKLMGEIDEICVKNSIPYLLYGRTARDAHVSHGFNGNYVYASIMMPADYFEKFEMLVKKHYYGKRAVEWIFNNSRFPGLHMRYVDLSSSFFYGDSLHKYVYPGVFISIERVRFIPSNRYFAKICNGIDRVIEYSSIEDKGLLNSRQRKAHHLLQGMMSLFGRERALRLLFRFESILSRKNKGKMVVNHYRQKSSNLSYNHFVKHTRIPFENRTFLMSSDSDEFLKTVYGKDWRDNLAADVSAPHLLACSVDIPFSDLLDSESINKLRRIDTVIAERKKIQLKMKPLESMIHRYWEQLFLTRDRFDAFRKYYPHRYELTERYRKNEVTVLKELTDEFMKLESKYIDEGYAMPVFHELDEIIPFLYEYDGDYKRADLFRERASQFMPINLDSNTDISEQTADDWPIYLCLNDDGTLPVIACDGKGVNYSIVFRTYLNKYINVLRYEKGAVMANDPGEDATLLALYGDLKINKEELFQRCGANEGFLRLYYKDLSSRMVECGIMTKEGEIIPTAVVEGLRYLGTLQLQDLFSLRDDRGLDCWLYVGEQVFGPAFWREADSCLPPVAVDLEGHLYPFPHNFDSIFVCRLPDESIVPVADLLATHKDKEAFLFSNNVIGKRIRVAKIDYEFHIWPLSCNINSSPMILPK